MYQFNYRKASSVEHAADLKANVEDGVYLAGGMTLIPTMKQRLAAPSDVIDVGGLTICAVSTSAQRCASAPSPPCRSRRFSRSSGAIAALSDLAEGIGDAHVRNRGTIGGSVANSDPAADYPAAVIGLGATVHTNRRSIAGDDFFEHLFETALEEGEIITSVEFPIPTRAAYAKFPNPASRYAIVGVMVAQVDRRRARGRHGCRALRLPIIGPRGGAGGWAFRVGPGRRLGTPREVSIPICTRRRNIAPTSSW